MSVRHDEISDFLARFTLGTSLHFHVGKYGRADILTLRVSTPSSREEIASFHLWDEKESLFALETLDKMVETDSETEFWTCPYRTGPVGWNKIGNKAWLLSTTVFSRDGWTFGPVAAKLYRRRLDEQQRILKGKLKRGHKAFGFYPLDGGA